MVVVVYVLFTVRYLFPRISIEKTSQRTGNELLSTDCKIAKWCAK